jgi:hypothetical protein
LKATVVLASVVDAYCPAAKMPPPRPSDPELLLEIVEFVAKKPPRFATPASFSLIVLSVETAVAPAEMKMPVELFRIVDLLRSILPERTYTPVPASSTTTLVKLA